MVLGDFVGHACAVRALLWAPLALFAAARVPVSPAKVPDSESAQHPLMVGTLQAVAGAAERTTESPCQIPGVRSPATADSDASSARAAAAFAGSFAPTEPGRNDCSHLRLAAAASAHSAADCRAPAHTD